MYTDNIKSRNGVDCEDSALIIIIIYLILG
jgi:hypothetical protein